MDVFDVAVHQSVSIYKFYFCPFHEIKFTTLKRLIDKSAIYLSSTLYIWLLSIEKLEILIKGPLIHVLTKVIYIYILMAGNEWINRYLQAILSTETGAGTIDEHLSFSILV